MERKAVSGIMLTLLLTSVLTLVFNIQMVKATGTIYIRTDGSVDPPTVPISSVDNITYTLTGDIVGSNIVIERDNIVVDGAGYALQGTEIGGGGISLSERSNVTIKNTRARHISYWHSKNTTISGNNITGSKGTGIMLVWSSNNTLSGNTVADNGVAITLFEGSDYNTISRNDITGNGGGISLLVNSDYNTISGNDIINNENGITIHESSNNTIYHNNFVNNTKQVNIYMPGPANVWDEDYPSGGNYWSDHVCTGNPSDGSQPYIIDGDNIDHYPFQEPNGWIPKLKHELIVQFDAPTSIGVGSSCKLEATVYNYGLSNETDVGLSWLINETEVESLVIPELLIGSSYTSSYLWTPSIEGVYNVSAYAPPMPDENVTVNNLVTRMVLVGRYQLTVNSSPVTRITFIIDGITKKTPHTEWLFPDSIAIVMPRTHLGGEGRYYWDQWSDGDTNRSRVVTMNRSITLTAHYGGPYAGVIYIRTDGSVYPPTAPISSVDNITYTFIDDINDPIVVERDNIVLDGAEYTLQGHDTGLDLTGRSNVTIKDMKIKSFGCHGIRLYESSNNTISGNNITDNVFGIWLEESSNNNTVSENNITNNYRGIHLDWFSDYNTVSGNNITNNVFGIWLEESSNNIISGNNITRAREFGICLGAGSSNNTITGNSVTNNGDYGILMLGSLHTAISGNNITNNGAGIQLEASLHNIISENSITNNGVGIWFGLSSFNKFYHNNFVDNTQHVYDLSWELPIPPSTNMWDNDYPSGGNYWSDYKDVDLCNGPNQDLIGMDGIWDHPCVIYAENEDRYPLVKPYPIVPATVDVDPDVLNLKSEGEWVTAYIELPEGFNVSDVDLYSVRLNDTFPVSLLPNPPVPVPTEIGDYDNDGVSDLMVKFNRTELAAHIYHNLGIRYGNVTLTVAGELADGTVFEGGDVVRVIFAGDVNNDKFVNLFDLLEVRDVLGTADGDFGYNPCVDLNLDGFINLHDLLVARLNLGAAVP